jgi:hypothetical protein
LSFSVQSRAAIVINEIMYHPASDNNDEEYLELYNTGDQAVNVSNYSFTSGIAYTFPSSVTIPAKGYLVVACNAAVIKALYGIENVVGNYVGQLSNSGETLVLEDNVGRIVDEVTYSDSAPWPTAADGDGPSLELINPENDNNDPFNWRSSAFPGSGKPWGTPGKANSTTSADLSPRIDNPRHRPLAPIAGESVSIRANVEDDTGIFRVWAEYMVEWLPNQTQTALLVPTNEWLVLELRDDGTRGDRNAGDGSYEANLPQLAAGVLVHYKIHALDFHAQENISPDPTNYPRQYGLFIQSAQPAGALADYTIFLSEENLTTLLTNSSKLPPEPAYNNRVRGVFIDHAGLVYEDVRFRFLGMPEERQAVKTGWKLFFNDGFEFDGHEELNLDAQFHVNNTSRRGDAGLYESMAWEIFRRAGVPSRNTQPITLNVNGVRQGVFLQKEHIEEEFLTRIGKDRDSNFYRSQGDPNRSYPGTRGDESVLPTLEDYVKTYDNVTNQDAPFDDLITFIQNLNGLSGIALANFLDASLNTNAMIFYLAAGITVVDTDRVWYNHYLYHDSSTGKWEVIPENLMRTFEHVDAHILMDVTGFPTFNGPWPLASKFLTNSDYQVEYYDRIRELLQSVYLERVLFPIIDAYVETVREEAEREQLIWGNFIAGYRPLSEHAGELKDFIRHRRVILLQQLPQSLLISNAYTQPTAPTSADAITFSLDVLASSSPKSVVLYYNINAVEQSIETELQEGSFSLYQATIPAQPDLTAIQYYFFITANDGAAQRYPSSSQEFFMLFVSDTPEPIAGSVVINEIMYNSVTANNEWFELYNPGDYPVDLTRWIFKDDDDSHLFTIPDGVVLPPDGYLVIAYDAALVAQWYGIANVIGNFTFNLGNGGDMVRIYNASGILIDSVEYDDESPWPTEADGNGPSLELISADLDNSLAASWRISNENAPTGTPGRRNSVTPPPTSVSKWMMY